MKYDDLLAAYEWVSSSPGDSEAFVSRITGNVHWSSNTMELDDDLPEDIEDTCIYVAVPNKHDLNLGKNLALTFAEEQLSDSYQTVADFFRRRGAYGRFKDLLERKGCLKKLGTTMRPRPPNLLCASGLLRKNFQYRRNLIKIRANPALNLALFGRRDALRRTPAPRWTWSFSPQAPCLSTHSSRL